MKKILILLICFSCSLTAISQTLKTRSDATFTQLDQRLAAGMNFSIPSGATPTLNGGLARVGSLFYNTTDNMLYTYTGSSWTVSSPPVDLSFNATTPSTSSVIGISGVTLGTTTIATTLQALLYPSQPPTATLTGGVQLELMASGAVLPYTLNWSASRQTATTNLTGIVVATVSQTFSNPSAPGTVSGTQAVSVVRNTNTTYTNTVTTADGKTATATTQFTFSAKKYWGRSVTTTPSNSELLAATGGGSEFSSLKAKTSFTITASGSNHIFYAYPSSFGAITILTIGGFNNFPVFTRQTISVTNALGYVQDYYVYTSNDTYSGDAENIIIQ